MWYNVIYDSHTSYNAWHLSQGSYICQLHITQLCNTEKNIKGFGINNII